MPTHKFGRNTGHRRYSAFPLWQALKISLKQDELLRGSQEGPTDIKRPHYSIFQYSNVVYPNI